MSRPDLAALLVDPACVAALTDALNRVALVDVLEVRALGGAVFGDGVWVVSSSPPGPWPPPSAWLPPPRTIDIHAHERPLAPLPVLGWSACHRAGSGWAGMTCHPPTSTKAIAAGANMVTTRTTAVALAPRSKPSVKRRGAQHGRAR